jgi:hypothetical protein
MLLFPADDAYAPFEQCYQHVESAPAEPDRPPVGEELATMRQHPETTERDARGRSGDRIHPPRRMNFHQQAAIDRHAWRIFQSYLP